MAVGEPARSPESTIGSINLALKIKLDIEGNYINRKIVIESDCKRFVKYKGY
jgi:hypothetical protein